MPIDDYAAAAQKIAALLKTLTTVGGLRLKYRITAGEGARDPEGLEAREIYVEMAGPDTAQLTQRGGEVLAPVAAKLGDGAEGSASAQHGDGAESENGRQGMAFTQRRTWIGNGCKTIKQADRCLRHGLVLLDLHLYRQFIAEN